MLKGCLLVYIDKYKKLGDKFKSWVINIKSWVINLKSKTIISKFLSIKIKSGSF